ncbi:MAG: c-type cytochrome domain-containing protein [Bacteroidota bacterium]
MKNLIALCFAFLALLAACKHKPDVEPSPTSTGSGTGTGTGTGTVTPTPGDTSICFERDILPIFIAGCSKPGCHDAASHQDGYTLTNYTSIMKGIKPGNAWDSDIYEAITEDKEEKRMPQPPNPRLTNEQIALIARWINEGAKNGTNCPPKGCDDNIYTYSGAIVPIVNTYCKGCHNSASAAGGIILDTYAGVKVVADNGKLVGATKRLAGFSPMPKGGNSLSGCQLSQIEKWVAAGAQNN